MRQHCGAARRCQAADPLLPCQPSPSPHCAAADGAAPAQLPAAQVAEARARALGFLSQVLGGDAVAAEYLLLQLFSRCAFAVPVGG